MLFLPPTGFVINLAILLAGGVDDWKTTTLEQALIWLVGVQGIVTASGHLFMPGSIAASIGWPTSRFQWEVGLASLSYGVLGVIATGFDRPFWLATIIAFSVFMVGAAVGHVRSMIADQNFAPGNAGYIFAFDVFVPAMLILLYVVTD